MIFPCKTFKIRLSLAQEDPCNVSTFSACALEDKQQFSYPLQKSRTFERAKSISLKLLGKIFRNKVAHKWSLVFFFWNPIYKKIFIQSKRQFNNKSYEDEADYPLI